MGYVGITTALVFAELGYQVTGMDPDDDKISSFQRGVLPFHEPGADVLLRKHLSQEKIAFSTDPQQSISNQQVIFICVGTPSRQDGNVVI